MDKPPLPGQDQQPAEITCPSCGRFVGALTRCPHCGARVAKRMSVRVLRVAALLLATVGLFLLYLMATHREVPLIKIGDVKPTMNMAYVRVAGTVSGDARMFKEGGRIRSMRFMVDDGTGEISVNAYSAQAQALADAGRVPRLGDQVDVAGSLGISADDNIVLRLQVPDHLVIHPADMAVTPLGDITSGLVGSSLSVEGTLTKVSPPGPESRAPWAVRIRDASGEKEITFWADAYQEIREKDRLVPGTPVRARVSVRTYRDRLQLSLARGGDLEFLGDAPPAERPASSGEKAAGAPRAVARWGGARAEAREVALGDITEAMAGQTVKTTGRVTEIKPPGETSAPTEVVLEDGGKQISVVYWDVVAQHLKGNRPVAGALMGVRGLVNVYQGKLQLKVTHSDQLSLVDVTPVSKPVPVEGEEAAIGSLTAAIAGQARTVRGRLGEPRSIRGGVIYPLSDTSGSIQLLLWDRSVPGTDRDRLAAGLRVKVTGEVREYKGALEIVPASPRAIEIEEAPAKP